MRFARLHESGGVGGLMYGMRAIISNYGTLGTYAHMDASASYTDPIRLNRSGSVYMHNTVLRAAGCIRLSRIHMLFHEAL
jgi:hypothetical protein